MTKWPHGGTATEKFQHILIKINKHTLKNTTTILQSILLDALLYEGMLFKNTALGILSEIQYSNISTLVQTCIPFLLTRHPSGATEPIPWGKLLQISGPPVSP